MYGLPWCPVVKNPLSRGFPVGSVVKNLPANAGETGSFPIQEDPTCPWAANSVCCSCWACAVEPGSHSSWSPGSATREACTPRLESSHSSPRLGRILSSNKDSALPKRNALSFLKKNLPSNAGGTDSISGWWTNIPQATGQLSPLATTREACTPQWRPKTAREKKQTNQHRYYPFQEVEVDILKLGDLLPGNSAGKGRAPFPVMKARILSDAMRMRHPGTQDEKGSSPLWHSSPKNTTSV